MEVEQLRGKLEARDTEKKRLEAMNAELQDSLLLRAQQGERDLRELETRWAGQHHVLRPLSGPVSCSLRGPLPCLREWEVPNETAGVQDSPGSAHAGLSP